MLDDVQLNWPTATFDVDQNADVDAIIQSMELGVNDLVAALDGWQAELRGKIA